MHHYRVVWFLCSVWCDILCFLFRQPRSWWTVIKSLIPHFTYTYIILHANFNLLIAWQDSAINTLISNSSSSAWQHCWVHKTPALRVSFDFHQLRSTTKSKQKTQKTKAKPKISLVDSSVRFGSVFTPRKNPRSRASRSLVGVSFMEQSTSIKWHFKLLNNKCLPKKCSANNPKTNTVRR